LARSGVHSGQERWQSKSPCGKDRERNWGLNRERGAEARWVQKEKQRSGVKAGQI